MEKKIKLETFVEILNPVVIRMKVKKCEQTLPLIAMH